jgi:hypothetical protein
VTPPQLVFIEMAPLKKFAWAKLSAISPPPSDIAVYLTDGFGSFPAEPPKVSSLWVILPGGLPSHKFPFGETARMTEKEIFDSLA